MVSDVDAGRARRVADELGAPHDARAFDVSDEASVVAAFDDIETRHGPISVLVSAAGLLLFQDNGERPLIKDTTLDIWERSFAVNARGVFLCGREFLRRREAAPVPHGRVVTFSSVAAQLGGYRSSASYIAAKSAVLGLTKAMARESAHLGITVNGIAPGLIDTDMLRSTSPAARARRRRAGHPAGPHRHRAGRGRRRPLPGLGRRRLHHGQHHRCQRRLPHAVATPGRSTQSFEFGGMSAQYPGQYPDQRQSRSASRHARRTGQHPAWTVLTAKMISNGRQP